MSALIGEKGAVQKPLVRYATDAGWTYLSPEEALRLRRGESGILLHEAFVGQLQKLNPGVVDLHRAEEVARRLTIVPPNVEGNLQAWEFLGGLKTVFVETERRERNVIAHGYFVLVHERIWETIQRDLPALPGQVERILAEWPEP